MITVEFTAHENQPVQSRGNPFFAHGRQPLAKGIAAFGGSFVAMATAATGPRNDESHQTRAV